MKFLKIFSIVLGNPKSSDLSEQSSESKQNAEMIGFSSDHF